MSRDFNGSSDRIIVTTDVVGSYPFAVCAYWRADVSHSGPVFSVGDPTVDTQQISCGVASSYRPHIRYDNGGTSGDIVLTPVGSADTWYRVVYVLNTSTDFRIYRDTISDTTSANPGMSYPSATNSYIGQRAQSTATYFDGKISDLSVIKLNPSTAQITALLKGADPRALFAPSDIVLQFPLVRDIYDVKGRAWTTTGTSVFANPGKIFAIPFVWDSTPAPAAGTTVAITGIAATAAVGNVADTVTQPITGIAATAAVGNVADTVTQPITGEAATAAVGNVADTVTEALTGEAATAAVGNVADTVTQSLTGEAATTAVGNVADTVTEALTGEAATGAVGTVTAVTGNDVTVAATGEAATGAVGSVAETLSVALTGEAATGAVGTVSTAAALISRRHRSRRARWYQGEIKLGEIISNTEATNDLIQEAFLVGGLARDMVAPYYRRSRAKSIDRLAKDAQELKKILRVYRKAARERDREEMLLLM